MSLDADSLRQRIQQSPDPDWTTFCACDAVLTETDQAAGYCTNCGRGIKPQQLAEMLSEDEDDE